MQASLKPYADGRESQASILMAGGEPLLVKVYSSHLSLLGYKVVTVGSGVECLVRYSELLPQLVVLDAGILWGRASGVLAVIGEHADKFNIPILVTYDRSSEDELSDLSSFRVSDYAAKPLAPCELATLVGKLLVFPLSNGEDRG